MKKETYWIGIIMLCAALVSIPDVIVKYRAAPHLYPFSHLSTFLELGTEILMLPLVVFVGYALYKWISEKVKK